MLRKIRLGVKWLADALLIVTFLIQLSLQTNGMTRSRSAVVNEMDASS